MKIIKHESPFAEWPGFIELPDYIDARMYTSWYERGEELRLADDPRPAALQVFDARFSMILVAELDLGTNPKTGEKYQVDHTGLLLPSPLIARWVNSLTDPLLLEASDLKNYAGPSTPTKTTKKK